MQKQVLKNSWNIFYHRGIGLEKHTDTQKIFTEHTLKRTKTYNNHITYLYFKQCGDES